AQPVEPPQPCGALVELAVVAAAGGFWASIPSRSAIASGGEGSHITMGGSLLKEAQLARVITSGTSSERIFMSGLTPELSRAAKRRRLGRTVRPHLRPPPECCLGSVCPLGVQAAPGRLELLLPRTACRRGLLAHSY